jgi:hypothetical protein
MQRDAQAKRANEIELSSPRKYGRRRILSAAAASRFGSRTGPVAPLQPNLPTVPSPLSLQAKRVDPEP